MDCNSIYTLVDAVISGIEPWTGGIGNSDDVDVDDDVDVMDDPSVMN